MTDIAATPDKQGVGEGGGKQSGVAHRKQSGAWLRASSFATETVRTALHEAMHLSEDCLTDKEMVALNSGIIAVPELPPGTWNDYYTAAVEVRANAFENWAYSYRLRGKLPTNACGP